jgi:hypothetical protein
MPMRMGMTPRKPFRKTAARMAMASATSATLKYSG